MPGRRILVGRADEQRFQVARPGTHHRDPAGGGNRAARTASSGDDRHRHRGGHDRGAARAPARGSRRPGAAGTAGREIERAPAVARNPQPRRRNAHANAGRDRRMRAPRRLAQDGARQFARRQRPGAGDRGARAQGPLRHAGRLDPLALVRAAARTLRRRRNATRHPRRRHRDLAHARVSPRPRAHGQGQELRVGGRRDGDRNSTI